MIKYELKADQHTSGYGGKWLNIDTPITVYARDFEEASMKALSLMSPPRTDTGGWRVFITRADEQVEEPEPKPHECPPAREVRRFRKKGAR